MLRILDSIARDRNIDRSILIRDLELAMVTAARKHFNTLDAEEFQCTVDPVSGQVTIFRRDDAGEYKAIDMPPAAFGRIAAQTFKQVMIQKFRDDERQSVLEEFSKRVGEIVTGTAQRYEGGSLVVTVDRTEGFMPRSEQIPGEQFNPGRVRCLILDVRDAGSQVKIVLSRGHPDFIKRLFEVEVPEVAEHIIEIKAMAREAGYRTKIAVSSVDSKVDPVGACVGVRGSRIKNIVDELNGEKIDIVRWNESSQILIANALKPAEVAEISLCFELGRATVVVRDDQLSLAIGKRGQNVRLAARLTGWDVDILTPGDINAGPVIVRGLDLKPMGWWGSSGFTVNSGTWINVFDDADLARNSILASKSAAPVPAQIVISNYSLTMATLAAPEFFRENRAEFPHPTGPWFRGMRWTDVTSPPRKGLLLAVRDAIKGAGLRQSEPVFDMSVSRMDSSAFVYRWQTSRNANVVQIQSDVSAIPVVSTRDGLRGEDFVE